MIPEFGRTLILLALACAAAGTLVGFVAGQRPTPAAWAWTRRCAYAFAAAMVAANLLMVYALLARDFSVGYVAHVGSRQVPTWVAIVSLWSSLEGSILFWGAVLGIYVAAATWANRASHPEYMPYATAVWMACATFFSFLLAAPAQPFATVHPVPPDGPGPNPLLQNHVLMAIHPPFLYAGYVGMTIPFGLACAALLAGRLGHDFLRPLRTWLLAPWIFLTVAIVMGGWWAYEVLGWGGYWAWDPVENASFLPWLTATAALHSLLLVERKGVLKIWTVTLVLASFLLTILGTFMTRSGVFNSVHSFTQSAIGPTILVFLAAALVFSVVLLALRVERLVPESSLERGLSRDGAFLLNNLLLVLFTFTVLVGTVFPLVVEATRGVQMSVGRPYFDKMAVPIGAALLFLLGVGPALPWGRLSGAQVSRALLPPLAGAGVLLLGGLLGGVRHPWTLAALAFGGYALQVSAAELLLPVRQRMRTHGESLGRALSETLLSRGRRRLGAYVVHIGVILVMVAVAASSTLGESREVQVKLGESVQIGRYTLTFLGLHQEREPHREAQVARVALERGDVALGELTPRMNQYDTQREPVGTPAVRSFLFEDVYLAIVNIPPSGTSVGLLALVNPMVGWIWAATGVMALGGVIGLLPRPRPAAVTVRAEAPATAAGYDSAAEGSR